MKALYLVVAGGNLLAADHNLGAGRPGWWFGGVLLAWACAHIAFKSDEKEREAA